MLHEQMTSFLARCDIYLLFDGGVTGSVDIESMLCKDKNIYKFINFAWKSYKKNQCNKIASNWSKVSLSHSYFSILLFDIFPKNSSNRNRAQMGAICCVLQVGQPKTPTSNVFYSSWKLDAQESVKCDINRIEINVRLFGEWEL